MTGRAAHQTIDRRAEARAEARHLTVRVQADLAGSAAAARRLVARAEAHRWWDVALLAEYAAVIAAAHGGDTAAVDPGIDAVARWAARSEDPAGRALALALRVSTSRQRHGADVGEVMDANLARAVVLLEQGGGGALERIAAHVECGLCYSQRQYWELEAEQYERALQIDAIAEEPQLAGLGDGIAGGRWAIHNNLAELQCRWMCSRYLAGDGAGIAASVDDAVAVVDQAMRSGLPDEWLPDLQAVRVLLEALAGRDVGHAGDLAADGLEAGTPFHGAARLATALSRRSSDPRSAAEETEEAVAELEGSDLGVEHDVALLLAVELEADRAGVPTAGLRLARHEHARRAGQRRAGIHSMRALLRAERFGDERASLERDARIDELTHLANRRGYQRYLDGLDRGADRAVALLAIDVDRFKDINDRYGHEAGDRALRRVAGVLAGHARRHDVAARMGGDEFALVLDGADAEAAGRRAEQIIATLVRRGRYGAGTDHPGAISVSIGIAQGPADQIEQLGRRADAALYEAKSAGGGRALLATIPFAPNAAAREAVSP